jgi:hypothetical protein
MLRHLMICRAFYTPYVVLFGSFLSDKARRVVQTIRGVLSSPQIVDAMTLPKSLV